MSTTEKHSQSQQRNDKQPQQAGAEGMWQSLVLAQLTQVEGLLQRIDATLKTQLAKSKEQVEEVNRLTTSAINWAGELQQGAVELALSTLKTAQDAVQKVRA